MKYTKKIYRRGRKQGRTRKTAIRPPEKKEGVVASAAELTAICRGRAQIKRGEYVTLDKLIDGLEAARRRKLEDEEDLAALEKALKEPGPSIPWEHVKKDLKIP